MKRGIFKLSRYKKIIKNVHCLFYYISKLDSATDLITKQPPSIGNERLNVHFLKSKNNNDNFNIID